MAFEAVIDDKLASVRGEPNPVVRLFKAIDLYEYLVKLQVVHLLHRLTRGADGDREAPRSLGRIASLLRYSFQRPSFGHWVGLLRDLQQLRLFEDQQDNVDFARIVPSAERIVALRNQFAHGITPAPDDAQAHLLELTPAIDAFCALIQRHHAYRDLHDAMLSTPFFHSAPEVYNGVKRRQHEAVLCEYLDYLSGGRSVLPSEPPIHDYFARYFQTSIEISSFEIAALLNDYFAREHWEEMLCGALRQSGIVFLHGSAGVGKTVLAARMAQHFNSDICLCSAARPSELTAERAIRRLYDSFRIRIGDLPPFPRICDREDITNLLHQLVQRYAGFKGESPVIFVFDGLDELPEVELLQLFEYLVICRNAGFRFLFCSRNPTLCERVRDAFGRVAAVELLPLTEGEVREWFRTRNPSLPYPSTELIREITETTAGNFLYLAALPADAGDESVVRRALAETPRELWSRFDRMVNGFEARDGNSAAALALLAVLRNGGSRELLQDFLELDRPATRRLLGVLAPVIKETGEGVYVLFHAAFVEYVKRELRREVGRATRRLVEGIERFESEIEPLTDVPDIFLAGGFAARLPKWIAQHTSPGENAATARPGERFAVLKAVVRAFDFLAVAEPQAFVGGLAMLDAFVDANFQVLVDWRLVSVLARHVSRLQSFVPFGRYPNIRVLCGAAAYVENDSDRSLAVLESLQPDLKPGTKTAYRCLDYLGLNHGFQRRDAEAIACYTELVEATEGAECEIWASYALVNRARMYVRSRHPELAIRDAERALQIKEAIATDERALRLNISDVGDPLMARLTLGMGYESLVLIYGSALALRPGNADYSRGLERNVSRLTLLLENLLAQYPEQARSFSYTGRMLLQLCEHYMAVPNPGRVRELFAILRKCFVRSRDGERFRHVQDYLAAAAE